MSGDRTEKRDKAHAIRAAWLTGPLTREQIRDVLFDAEYHAQMYHGSYVIAALISPVYTP